MMTDLNLIDHNVINKLASDIGMTPEEAVPFFLDSLENDVDQSFSEMKIALESNDSVRLQRAAHKMKGSCNTLGAVAAATLAEELETTDYRGMTNRAVSMVQRLDTTWQASMVELKKISS